MSSLENKTYVVNGLAIVVNSGSGCPGQVGTFADGIFIGDDGSTFTFNRCKVSIQGFLNGSVLNISVRGNEALELFSHQADLPTRLPTILRLNSVTNGKPVGGFQWTVDKNFGFVNKSFDEAIFVDATGMIVPPVQVTVDDKSKKYFQSIQQVNFIQSDLNNTATIKMTMVNVNDCRMCTEVQYMMQKYLKGNYTQSKVNEILPKVCSLVPSQHKQQCYAWLPMYQNQIAAYIVTNQKTTNLCQAIHQCL